MAAESTDTAAVEEATPEPATRQTAFTQFAEHMRARHGGDAPPDPPGDPAPEPAPVEKPEPAKPAPDDAEKRLARALRDLQRLETENTKLKRGRSAPPEYEAELAKARGLLAKGRSMETVLDFLEEATGLDYEGLTKAIVEGTAKAPSKLPPAVSDRIRALEERDKAREAELAQHREAQAFEGEVTEVKGWLAHGDNAEKYPLLAATSWGPAQMVSMARARGGTTAEDVAVDLEKSLQQNVVAILQDQRALRSLVKSSAKIQAALREALGDTGQAPAKGASSEPGKKSTNGGRSLSSYSSGSAPADRSKMTEAEKSRRAASEFARILAARRN